MKTQKLLKLSEASEMLNVHPNTLRKWDKKGILKPIRFGIRNDRRYDIVALTKLINANQSSALANKLNGK